MKPYLESAYDLKSLIETLFGKRAWSEVKNSDSLQTWKKYASKVLAAIEKSAVLTVTISDAAWHDELRSLVEQGKKRINGAKDTESVFASLSASLAKISFHQLGQTPDNRMHTNITLRSTSNWTLDKHRSVQYVQTEEQRMQKEHDDKRWAT